MKKKSLFFIVSIFMATPTFADDVTKDLVNEIAPSDTIAEVDQSLSPKEYCQQGLVAPDSPEKIEEQRREEVLKRIKEQFVRDSQEPNPKTYYLKNYVYQTTTIFNGMFTSSTMNFVSHTKREESEDGAISHEFGRSHAKISIEFKKIVKNSKSITQPTANMFVVYMPNNDYYVFDFNQSIVANPIESFDANSKEYTQLSGYNYR